jgi:hypothetical protein
LGAVIETVGPSVRAPERTVHADFLELTESRTEIGRLYPGRFLPGYEPDFSEPFEAWLEQQRGSVDAALRRSYVASMTVARQRGDWSALEQTAQRCLEVDCLNEEATLGLAEATAMQGSKVQALQLLDRYLKEIGPAAREMRLPAVVLKNRITRSDLSLVELGRAIPFVGRDAYLHQLNEAYRLAHASHGTFHFIWGEPGIGKTRLIRQFASAANLDPIHVVAANLQSSDHTRPFSCFLDLLPKLLVLPGALACSPSTLARLRSLCGRGSGEPDYSTDPQVLASENRRAILELLDCIIDEQLLLLIFEDIHWIDALSLELLQELAGWASTRKTIVIASSRTSEFARRTSQSAAYAVQVHQLLPLSVEESRHLLERLRAVVPLAAPKSQVARYISASGGNPYHLTELALRSHGDGASDALDGSLTGLIKSRFERLQSNSLRVLQAIAILGKHATTPRILALLDMPNGVLIDALDELEKHAFIECAEEAITCRHDLVASGALTQIGEAARRALHYKAAQALTHDVHSKNTPLLLWDSAEHWLRAGEHPTAISEMRKCASLALNLGSPSEAARMIDRALELCGNRPYRAGLLEQRVEILRRGGLWADLVCAVQELTSLSPLDTASERHWDQKLMLLEARRRSGADPGDLLPEAMECVREAQAHTHRILAAALIFKLCDNTLLAAPAHSAFAVIEPLLARADTPALVRLEAEMIYHCAFGDLDRVPEIAVQLVEAARASDQPPTLSQMLGYAAIAMRLAGHLDAVKRLAFESYEIAAAHGIAPLAAPPAEILANLARLAGDDAGAKKWISESVCWARRSQKGFGGPGMLQEAAFLAIVHRDYAQAEQMLDESARSSTIKRYRRSRLAQLSFSYLLNLERQGQLPNNEELTQLLQLYDEAKEFTLDDGIPYTISRLLSGLGQESRARATVLDFAKKSRRSRAPLLPELAAEVNRLQCSSKERTS